MKITYIHQYFNTPAMVGSTRSFETARRLVQMGHEVNLITTRRDGTQKNVWEITNESGITVNWVSIPYSNKMGFSDRLRAFFLFVFYAARRAAVLQTDVVFATSTPLTIALPAIYAKWRQRVPLVLEIRDLWPEVPIAMGVLVNPVLVRVAKWLEKFAYANAEKIIALSPDMRDGIVRVGYPLEKIDVIPNGSDPDFGYVSNELAAQFRIKHGIPLDATLMVYAGTLGRVNGVGYLVKLAAALIEDSRFFMLIVGDGVEGDEIFSSARELGIVGKNFTMLPPVPKAQMPPLLNAADIVISTVIPIPALEANSANKVFDGMSAGRCIAINHGGWLAALLKEADAGLVLSQDINVAADQIRHILNSPERISHMKANAQKLADNVFSRDKLAAQLESNLKQVVHEKKYGAISITN